jgi:hypothetical protein
MRNTMPVRPALAVCAAAGVGLLSLTAACGSAGHAVTGQAVSSSTTSQASAPASAASTSASAMPGSTADVCALVTQQEASAAFGTQSSAPQPATSPVASGKACAYFANANKDSLQVGLLTHSSLAQLATIKSSIQLPGAATSSPSGIGDSATVMGAGPTAIVIFTKHSNVVVLTLNMLGQSTPVHAATVLAKEAAARL